MKVWLLIIISFFSKNLIKNANSVGERGQAPKLYKTFDEIFGKGWDDESNDSKDLNCRHVKEEVQDGQAPNTFDQKNIDEISKQKFDEIFYDENWSEDENNSAPSEDDIDQDNSKKHLSDQNNSTDQDESVDEQQNESKSEKIKTDQQKREILKQFDDIKSKFQKAKLKNISMRELDDKIAKELFVSAATIYVWKRKFSLSVSNKKFSDFEKLKILKQFDQIKSKCKKAKLKNISMRELDDKIAKELFVSVATIYVWKRKFSLSVSNKKFSAFEKLEILKQFDQIKSKCKQAKLKGGSKHERDETIAKKREKSENE